MTSPNKEYKLLEEILADLFLEEQAKLGFFKEDIRLYYPLSSLNHFFSARDSADELATVKKAYVSTFR